jgi:type VI secretion system protein ImpJ
MSKNSKVIWSEGMFPRPQHFQQQDRYFENFINNRCIGLQAYAWGVYNLKIDFDLLNVGQIALKTCNGIFPDGTPFNLPEDDDLPLPLELPENIHGEIIYLALPLRRQDAQEIENISNTEGLARFRIDKWEVRDSSNFDDAKVPIQVGKLRTRLMKQSDERSGYTCLGVVRVIEVQADKKILIDDQFIPANLNCFFEPRIHSFLKELSGLLNRCNEILTGRIVATGQGKRAKIADFILLQMVNRYLPLIDHLSHIMGLHPESFYRCCVQLAGELATFFRADKRPLMFPAYKHEDLKATFRPLMEELRQILSKIYKQPAIQLSLKGPKFDTYAAKRPDLNLMENAAFVLAVYAEMPAETLRQEFPRQIIISPFEEIRQNISSQTPGIAIHPLPEVPKQMPCHAGFIYFEMDKSGELWEKMASSEGFAFHIGGNYPGLKLEFWAIGVPEANDSNAAKG